MAIDAQAETHLVARIAKRDRHRVRAADERAQHRQRAVGARVRELAALRIAQRGRRCRGGVRERPIALDPSERRQPGCLGLRLRRHREQHDPFGERPVERGLHFVGRIAVDAADDHHVELAASQEARRDFERGKRRRMPGVDGHVHPVQIVIVRHARRNHVRHHAGERILGRRRHQASRPVGGARERVVERRARRVVEARAHGGRDVVDVAAARIQRGVARRSHVAHHDADRIRMRAPVIAQLLAHVVRGVECHQLAAIERAQHRGRHAHAIEARQRIRAAEARTGRRARAVQPCGDGIAAVERRKFRGPADDRERLAAHARGGFRRAQVRPIFADDQMAVRAAEAEARHRGDARRIGLARPVHRLSRNREAARFDAEFARRLGEAMLRRNASVLEREQHLDQRDDARRPTGMADERLVRRHVHRAIALEFLAQALELGEVARRGAGRMRDHPVDRFLAHVGLPVRALDRDALARRVRRVDRLALAVRRRTERLQHAEHAVAVGERALQALQDHDARAVGEQHAVARLVERAHFAALREPVQLREQNRAARRERERAAARDDIVPAGEQALDAEVDRIERRRARGVDHHVFGVIGQHAAHRVQADAMREIFGQLARAARIARAQHRVDLRDTAFALVGRHARFVERLAQPRAHRREHHAFFQMLTAVRRVADEERRAIARAHAHAVERLAQRMAQPQRRQLVRRGARLDFGAQSRLGLEMLDEHRTRLVALVFRRRIGRIERSVIPTIGRHVAEQLGAVQQCAPERLRVARAGQRDAHADDGDFVGVGVGVGVGRRRRRADCGERRCNRVGRHRRRRAVRRGCAGIGGHTRSRRRRRTG
ncbi:hypothetical protein BG92_3528 [Burkholderia pseudomallei 406e]|nr:hypothetical protein BG92_3528 [Burkholderia pseudomallei 406e]